MFLITFLIIEVVEMDAHENIEGSEGKMLRIYPKIHY